MRKEREAGEDFPSEVEAEDLDAGDASALDPSRGQEPATADLHPCGQASGDTRPVIIEFCCAVDSQVGNVNYLGGGNNTHKLLGCRVVRITKEDCDVTTSGGA